MRIDVGEEEDRGINLAPLLDCIFLLLIFFMITTSFNQEKTPQLEIPLELPRLTAGLTSQPIESLEAFRITVDRSGGIHLNAVPCDLADLHRILKMNALVNPSRPIVILGDREVSFNRVTRIMELCHLLGCRNVSVRAERKE